MTAVIALEHGVPEQLFSTPDSPVEGISAVKALQLAAEQGIPIYTVTQENIATVLPQLQLSPEVINEIENAVNSGKEVTVSKTNIDFYGWVGCGYVVMDPLTGEGAYKISGGLSGSAILQILAGIAWVIMSIPLLIFPPLGIASILGGVAMILDGFKNLFGAVWGFYKDVTWDFYYNEYNGIDVCILGITVTIILAILALDAFAGALGALAGGTAAASSLVIKLGAAISSLLMLANEAWDKIGTDECLILR